MKKSSPKTSELAASEWTVMKAVWSNVGEDPEVTVAEVMPEVLKHRKWHVSTLKTTMNRLVEKGYLARRVRGKTSFYKPLVSRERVVGRSVGLFLDTVLDGAFEPLVAYLSDRKGLSRKEVKELERILETKDEGA